MINVISDYKSMNLNLFIEKTRTIKEKRKSYSKEKKVNNEYLEEWRQVRTLLNDKYFEQMLKESNISKDEFTYCLQPSNENMQLDSDEWVDIFREIIETFDYDTIDFSIGVNVATLPFSKYLSQKIRTLVNGLQNVKVCEEVIEKFIISHAVEMFGILLFVGN